MGIKQKSKKLKIDILKSNQKQDAAFNLLSFQDMHKNKPFSVFFSKKGIVQNFFTGDSGLYFDSREMKEIGTLNKISGLNNSLDGLYSRNVQKRRAYSIGKADLIALRIRRRYSKFNNYFEDLLNGAVEGVSWLKPGTYPL